MATRVGVLMGQDAQARLIRVRPLGRLHALWGVIATLLVVLYTAILAPVAAVVAFYNHGHPVTIVARIWTWLIFRTSAVTIDLRGLENLAGLDSFVMVANHQSFFDIFAILRIIPREVRFIAKRELTRIPVFGFAMRKSGNIIVDRKSGGQAIRRSLSAVQHGYSICVFAEGKRYLDNRVHQFEEGAAWLAIATQLPCVPAAISGTHAIMPRGAKFVVPGRTMRISLGKPIPTHGLKGSDRKELTRELEARVQALFVPEL
ncbi:MAG: lysophospholipid acyltransferase family protein [Candidatus Binataceae bacterium]